MDSIGHAVCLKQGISSDQKKFHAYIKNVPKGNHNVFLNVDYQIEGVISAPASVSVLIASDKERKPWLIIAIVLDYTKEK